MLASEPRTAVDLYEWLPPCGENSVSYQYDGSRLCVEIRFEDTADDSVERQKNLVFTGVCSMHVSYVPGVDTLNLEYDEPCSSRAVVEYMNSEAAAAWSDHFDWSKETIRHFQVFFAYANQRLEVFAEDCTVE